MKLVQHTKFTTVSKISQNRIKKQKETIIEMNRILKFHEVIIKT